MDKKKTNLVLIIFGILIIIVGITVFTITKLQKSANECETYGKVVAYEEVEEYDSSDGFYYTAYRPVITFSDGTNDYKYTYSQSYSEYPYTVGGSVKINYDPDNPSAFTIADDKRENFIVLWMVPVGAAMAAFGIYKTIKDKKQTAAA